MPLRIKVSRAEFKAACSNGFVYGDFQGKRGIYVYAELGMEKAYISQPHDDPKTRYRIFSNCVVFFAKTKAQRKIGQFETQIVNSNVIIYC